MSATSSLPDPARIDPAGSTSVTCLADIGVRRGDQVRWRARDSTTWNTGRVVGLERDRSISLIDSKGSWRAIRQSQLSVRIANRWVPLVDANSWRIDPKIRPRRSVRREERIVRDYLDCLSTGRVPVLVQRRFIESARRWAEFRGISAEALASVGVPKAVLLSAEVPSMPRPRVPRRSSVGQIR